MKHYVVLIYILHFVYEMKLYSMMDIGFEVWRVSIFLPGVPLAFHEEMSMLLTSLPMCGRKKYAAGILISEWLRHVESLIYLQCTECLFRFVLGEHYHIVKICRCLKAFLPCTEMYWQKLIYHFVWERYGDHYWWQKSCPCLCT